MKKFWVRVFLFLIVVEGAFVQGAMLSSPSEADSARFLGLSTSRLAIFGVVVIISLMASGSLIITWKKESWFVAFLERIESKLKSRGFAAFILGAAIFLTWVCSQFAFYSYVAEEPVVQSILQRLLPMLIWLALGFGQLFVLILFWHFDLVDFQPFQSRHSKRTLAILVVFLIVWIWLAVAGYGFSEETDETGFFRSPGTPILGVQVLLAGIIAFGFAWMWGKLVGKLDLSTWKRFFYKDILIAVLIWGVAFALWMAAPLEPSWFADEPRPPNNTFSPNSDALVYDSIAHNLLVGSGFWHPDWETGVRRPMLSALVAVFHLIGGLDYEGMIWGQVAFLAIFPVAVYLITSSLHQRTSGMLTALLIVIRERNAILLADTITVSHAKVIMSDLPGALGVAVFVLFIIWWLKAPKERAVIPLIAGGLLGFFMLIRSEVIILLAAVALPALWLLRRKPLLWFKGMVFSVLGITLMIAPWMWRNYQARSYLYLDKNMNYAPIIEKIKDIFGDLESHNDFLANNQHYKDAYVILNPHLKSTDQSDFSSINLNRQFSEISFVDNFLNHFFNSQTQLVMIFPMSPNLLISFGNLVFPGQADLFWSTCCSPESYVRSLPYWWSDWDGNLAKQSFLPVALALVFVAVGLSRIWEDRRVLGLIPIAVCYAFVLSFALNSMSGGRWLLGADWVSMMLFSVGFVEITHGIAKWVRSESSQTLKNMAGGQEIQGIQSTGIISLIGIAVIIFLTGYALLYFDRYKPRLYTSDERGIAHRHVMGADSFLSETDISEVERLLSSGLSGWYGRALYPRYYQSGDGMDGKSDAFKRPFSRVEFYMVGHPNSAWILLPIEFASQEFPHAVDVLVIGCNAEDYIDAAAVVINPMDEDSYQGILWRDNSSVGEIECSENSN